MDTAIIENALVIATVKALLKAGYKISVDGEDKLATESYLSTLSQIDLMGSNPAEYIYAHSGGTTQFVRFVYGNGTSVISDYHIGLEKIMEPVNEFAEAMENDKHAVTLAAALAEAWERIGS